MKTQTVLKLRTPVARTNLDYDSVNYQVYLTFGAYGMKQVEGRPSVHAMSVEEAERLVQKLQIAIDDAKRQNERLGKSQ